GGGGGSKQNVTEGYGANGIVIIRYGTADFGACTGGTITTDGADTIHAFTSSGTFTVALPAASPTVTTGSATNVTSNSATLSGTVNANDTSTTAWFNYGIASGSYTGTSTTQTVSGSSNTTISSDISGLSSNTTYYYRIAASNSGGTAYGSEASFTTSSVPTPTPTPAPTDTTAPTGSISINSGASYINSTTVTLTLSATDSVGVVGYYVSTSSSTPTASASGWNSVTSTTSYTGSVSYTLASGDENKTVYVWYKDAAGNVSSVASDSITLDTTAPIVNITSPTSSDTYTTTSSPLSLSGSASDSSSSVKEVTWSNDKGGSGTASGTTYWSVSSISLSIGDNIINVTATDNAGNTGKDTITVTYTVQTSTPTPTPTTTPKPSPIQTPTPTSTLTGSININGGATYTNSTTVTLNLSASNIIGVTGYYLSTSSTKPSSGDTGWTSISSTASYSADVSYSLSSGNGNQTVYVWYKDTAGNISDVANDSIILDTTAPTITITSPTSDSTYTTTSSTISLGGSASDSTSWLNSVTWSNSRGGSATASGTIGWSISNIDLASGANTITVTAVDGAGNTGTGTITVTYETSTQTPTTTPTPTPTPTLINCIAESIAVSQYKLELKRKETYDVTIAVSGEDDCLVEGEIVTATINATGKRLISISPSTQATDENGEAMFTITAKNKIGIARVTFSAGGFKKSITVKVKR
ncbi:MAG: hypothetical protein AAB339_05220, partial [Elusimicrobiota bacterium]